VNRFLFYLFSGLKTQARALVDFAVKRLGGQNPPIAIIYPEDEMLRGVTEAIEAQSKKHGWPSVRKLAYPPGRFDAVRRVKEGRQEGVEVVFFLGSGGEASALVKEAEKLSWIPNIFLLGSLVGQEILDTPLPFADKIFLSYPTLPSDHTRAGIKKYRTLAAKHRLPPRHLAIQVLAYCAAKILVEGLKRAGKDLSREKLITALEGLYEFETGLTPPITYGPNRRIGALGAYVVAVNVGQKTLVPVSRWLTPQ
jgi:ABC-type branched-subunit amino acid transport system substrate-binding protein